MESKKSSPKNCAFAAIRHMNFKRSWWMWLIFGVVALLLRVIPLYTLRSDIYVDHKDFIFDVVSTAASLHLGTNVLSITFIFAFFSALQHFSYLTNANASGFIHALPSKKETIFFANYLGGLLPFFVIYAITMVLDLLLAAVKGYPIVSITIVGFFAACAMTFIFYSIAVLCIMITGIAVAAGAFYLILNFLSLMIEEIIRLYITTFLYGSPPTNGGRLTAYLSPFYKLSTNLTYDISKDAQISFGGLQYLVIYVAAGLLITAVALFCYKKRKNESAGDLLVFLVLKPLFKYGFACCAGLLSAIFLMITFTNSTLVTSASHMLVVLFFLIVSTTVFYIVAEMLVEKTFRVFHKRTFRLVLPALVVLSVFTIGLHVDPIGYETKLPAASDVSTVYIEASADQYYYATLSGEEQTAALLALHQEAIDEQQMQESYQSDLAWSFDTNYTSTTIYIDYELTDGKHIKRQYTLHMPFEDVINKKNLAGHLYNIMTIPQVANDIFFAGSDASAVSALEFYNLNAQSTQTIKQEDREAFFDALALDFADGMLYDTFFEYTYLSGQSDMVTFYNDYLTVELISDQKDTFYQNYSDGMHASSYSHLFDLSMPNCENTISFLLDHGYLHSVEDLSVNEYYIEDFMEALE